MSPLPIINIAALYGNDTAAKMAVARALDDACRHSGFFYIVGHTIPRERIAELTAMARRLFSQPMANKLRIDITKSTHHRGYGAPAAEQLDPRNPSDWKETFDMSYDLPADHPAVRAGKPLRGANRHPDNIDGWQALMDRHYADMQALAMTLLSGLALALDAPADFFVDKFHEPLSVFRIIHYPALPEAKGRVVCGDHTDYGIVTLLYQDGAGGLQVRSLDGQWIDAPPVDGSFVVNIGDMMAMWSNNRYRSTHHRVVNPGIDRISMPFFCEPNPETIISCLPNCQTATQPRKYPDVKAADWLQKRFAQTYAYRKSTL